MEKYLLNYPICLSWVHFSSSKLHCIASNPIKKYILYKHITYRPFALNIYKIPSGHKHLHLYKYISRYWRVIEKQAIEKCTGIKIPRSKWVCLCMCVCLCTELILFGFAICSFFLAFFPLSSFWAIHDSQTQTLTHISYYLHISDFKSSAVRRSIVWYVFVSSLVLLLLFFLTYCLVCFVTVVCEKYLRVCSFPLLLLLLPLLPLVCRHMPLGIHSHPSASEAAF